MEIQKPRLIHLTETDSTNQFMQMIAGTEELVSGSIVLADFQTAGRGQVGNYWESEAGKNLTFSIFLCPTDVPANRSFVISEMASLSVKYTLDKYIPDVSVKWPNDIYYQDRKIAGILIENTILQNKITQSVIGIGLNVNQTHFCSNAPNPISIAQITEQVCDRMPILEDFRSLFAEQTERLDSSCFDVMHNDYLYAIYRKDGYHRYCDANGIFEAVMRDIEPTGHLILERRDGTCSRYAFKEVTYMHEAH
ncbi:biotin--[acetyl-CoA-carboxylase] ligase [Bacteroides sp. OttesenSCG-928-D19]|nr:biotin--[acetyl-CoA-carboxylase] ligase [Bacteroides sp. OttesenSCG-928-D19]